MAISDHLETANGSSPKRKKKRSLWKRIILRTALILIALMVLTGVAVGIALYTVFTPEKITPIVLNFANDYLEAEVGCESVELTFFSTFPNLGIVLKNGKVIKSLPVVADSTIRESLPQDTLVTFRRCLVSFNPVAFLTDRKIIVHSLKLDSPGIYAYVNPEGIANWNILPQTDTIEDTAKFQLPELNIKGVRVTDAHIIYDDRAQDIFAAVDSMYLAIDGNMSKDSAMLGLSFGMKTLTTFYEGQALVKRLPLEIEAQLSNNRVTRRMVIEQALITAGVLGFDATGTMQGGSMRHQAMVDLEFRLSASSLPDLLQMIPAQVSDIGDKVLTTGELSFHGELKGYLGKGSFPVLTASARLENGSLRSAKYPEKTGLKKIDIDGDALIDFTKQTASHIRVGNIFLESASSTVKCSGRFDNMFAKPFIDANIEADIDFNRMAQDLPFADSMQMGGSIRANLSGKCLLDDVLAGNYGKINASGKVDIGDVVFKYSKEEIDFFAPLVKLRLGSNTKDSIRGRMVESLLRGSFELDSIFLRYGTKLSANAGKLSAGFFTSAPKDSGAIAVLVTTARAENLHLEIGDSLQARAVKTSAMLRLIPSAEDKSKPELSARITLESFRGRMPLLGGFINNASFNMKLKQHTAQVENVHIGSRMRRVATPQVQVDSIAWARRADSIRQQYRATSLSFQLASDNAREMLQDLEISGTFECKNMNLRTPVFPLPIRMMQSSLDFTTNSLLLTKTRFRVGKSDMVLSGNVTGIKQALLRNGRLTAKMDIESNKVDVNQLIRAFAAGSDYASKDVVQRDSIAEVVMDDTRELAAPPDTGRLGIFVVPRNVDLELDTRIKKLTCSNLSLGHVSGKILVRNQAVQLAGLQLESEVGSAHMSLVYKAPNTKGANLGMDLQMNRIQVKELTSAFPVIDTLAPMLRSFDGVVDCNMAAVTRLDSHSNVILPETTASCYLKGKDMVLMDGETFAEISKMLMFKNKKHNLIDSISVEMILEDNKLMIFPFQVSIDRYVAGVGGTQNLDMSFSYHISVLKSPLPFKLGLNLSGTPDKIQFRLANAKYKDLFTPAKDKSLASTQVNLRHHMEESLRKSIGEIMDEPLTAPVRRPRVALNDSLQREYFQLDTTRVELIEQ